MVDVDVSRVESAAGEIGATAAVGDVAESADVDRLVAETVERTGRIDVIFNNAGLLRDKVLWKLDDEDWAAVVEVSLGGTFRFTRAARRTFGSAATAASSTSPPTPACMGTSARRPMRRPRPA